MAHEIEPEALEAYSFRRTTHPEALERTSPEWEIGEVRAFERAKVFVEGEHVANGFVEVYRA